jgi:transposase
MKEKPTIRREMQERRGRGGWVKHRAREEEGISAASSTCEKKGHQLVCVEEAVLLRIAMAVKEHRAPHGEWLEITRFTGPLLPLHADSRRR